MTSIQTRVAKGFDAHDVGDDAGILKVIGPANIAVSRPRVQSAQALRRLVSSSCC
jgi:hypothetical protein